VGDEHIGSCRVSRDPFHPDADRSSVVTVSSVASRLNRSQNPLPYKYQLALWFRDARTGRLRSFARSDYESVRRVPISIDVAPDGQSVAVASADRIDVWQRHNESGRLEMEHGRAACRPTIGPDLTGAVHRQRETARGIVGRLGPAYRADGFGFRLFGGSLPVCRRPGCPNGGAFPLARGAGRSRSGAGRSTTTVR
jgi:hypothetical protein